MKGAVFALATGLCGAALHAEPLLPTAPGTTWHYAVVRELGKSARLPESGTPESDGRIRQIATHYIAGPEKIGSVAVVKFEMHVDGSITNTELYAVSDSGIVCHTRIPPGQSALRLDPPQRILSAPLRAGEQWDYQGRAGSSAVNQNFSVIGLEDIEVPAGKFRAFHIRVQEREGGLMRTQADRWFVPGVGFIKDVTTITFQDGELIQRTSLELMTMPAIAARPEIKPATAPKKLQAALAAERLGAASTMFQVNVAKIYCRWQGLDLPAAQKLRAVWIAEDVGDAAPANYKMGETTLTTTRLNDFGTFSYPRPDHGWPVGKYRVEIFVGDELAESAAFTVQK